MKLSNQHIVQNISLVCSEHLVFILESSQARTRAHTHTHTHTYTLWINLNYPAICPHLHVADFLFLLI